jgi:hypothetical protein
MTNVNTEAVTLNTQNVLGRTNGKGEADELWVSKTIQLKFLLGEIPLFVVKFPALFFNAHFTELTTDPDDLLPPFERYSSKLEAILIRSHPVNGELPRLISSSQSIRYVPAQYHRYYIDLQGTFTDYLGKFSAKSRSTLQRKVRKFAEFSGGEVSWRVFRHPQEMDEFYHLAREVSQKTYQERLLNVGLPEGDEFRRELRELSTQEMLRAYILFHDERPIAYLYCPIQEDILFYRHLGYNPDFKQWSPGTVLQHVALESLFAEGKFRMFDFTEGQGPHKEFFSTGSMACADIYYFRPTFRNQLLLKLHLCLGRIAASAVKMLDRFGLKSRIKKLIRSK